MIQVSSDPEVIRGWAEEALASDLFREDGMARLLFLAPETIRKMAYVPGRAWVIDCDRRPRYQAFTHPEHRRQGHCERLCRAIDPDRFDPIYDAKITRHLI